MLLPILISTLAFLLSALLVLFTLNSAIRTFVLPRGDNVGLTRMIFQKTWGIFRLRIRWAKMEEERLAMFIPQTSAVSLLVVCQV